MPVTEKSSTAYRARDQITVRLYSDHCCLSGSTPWPVLPGAYPSRSCCGPEYMTAPTAPSATSTMRARTRRRDTAHKEDDRAYANAGEHSPCLAAHHRRARDRGHRQQPSRTTQRPSSLPKRYRQHQPRRASWRGTTHRSAPPTSFGCSYLLPSGMLLNRVGIWARHCSSQGRSLSSHSFPIWRPS